VLLAEARDLAPKLGIDVGDVQAIEKSVADHASQDAVGQLIVALAARVTALTGVAPQPLPPEAPSVERGAALFHDNCATCHGADGAGDGDESKRLGLKPANFTDVAFMRGETPDDFFNVITLGRGGSGMPAWSDALSVQERWDLVASSGASRSPRRSSPEGRRARVVSECAARTAPVPAGRSDDDAGGPAASAAGRPTRPRGPRSAALRARAEGVVATPVRDRRRRPATFAGCTADRSAHRSEA
jgi:mono/diheme cytochrome c family protein